MLNLIPTWLLVVVAVVVVLAVLRYFGKDAAIFAAAGALLALFAKSIRRDAQRDAQEKELKDAVKTHEEGAAARADADRRNADPVELRNDDGWRRD